MEYKKTSMKESAEYIRAELTPQSQAEALS